MELGIGEEYMNEEKLDATDFTVKEREEILERVEQLLSVNLDKVTYKNRMLYLTTKKSMITFSFDEVSFSTGEYYLSSVTVFDNALNTITGINKEKGYKDIWDRIDKMLLGIYTTEIKKHKIPIDDVLRLLEVEESTRRV